jgi:plastocyanin
VPFHAMKRLLPKLSTVSLALGLLALAGCGSSSSNSTSSSAAAPTPTTSAPGPSTTAAASTPAAPAGAGSSLSLSANSEGQLKYNTTSLTANAGKVSIAFSNPAPEGHNVTIETSAGKVIGATPTFQGGSKTLSVDLKPGTYKFFCSVPGHRMGGMEGTLTVK